MTIALSKVDFVRGDYRRASRHRQLGLALSVLALIALMLLDLTTGPSGMPLNDVLKGLIAGPAGEDRMTATILWQLRMPQTVMGLVVGACLGLAGLQMQTILDNPLASPFTLGFSAAAGFGAALAIMFGGALAIPDYFVVPISAFAMTLVACGLVYLIATLRGASPEILVLGGIAFLSIDPVAVAVSRLAGGAAADRLLAFWQPAEGDMDERVGQWCNPAVLPAVCRPQLLGTDRAETWRRQCSQSWPICRKSEAENLSSRGVAHCSGCFLCWHHRIRRSDCAACLPTHRR